jgi:hypothetical protein
MERAWEHKKHMYQCFIDYSKAFDSVEHLKIQNIMINMGISEHLIMLIETYIQSKKSKCRLNKA